MGEREQNRATVEHMAAEYKKHEAQRGNHLTAGEAKARIAEIARETDAKKEAGALRNKRQRSAKKPEEPPPQRRRSNGPRIFIDLGKKG